MSKLFKTINLVGVCTLLTAGQATGQQVVEITAQSDVQIDLTGGLLSVTDGDTSLLSDIRSNGDARGIGLEFPLAGLPDAALTAASLRFNVGLFESTMTGPDDITLPVAAIFLTGGGGDGLFTAADVVPVIVFPDTEISDLGVTEIDLPLDTPTAIFVPAGNTLGEVLEMFLGLARDGADPGVAITLNPPVDLPAELTFGVSSTEIASSFDSIIAPTLVLTFVPEPTSAVLLAAAGLLLATRRRPAGERPAI